MEKIGISLGWNCTPAIYGVEHGIRKSKSNGYRTCPFDEMISNLKGLIECLDDDFRYLTDSNYLSVVPAPFASGGIKKGEPLIYNTKYKFIFNHESPGHADLYLSQKWEGGINNFIDEDFRLFKERYNRRVDNFRDYLNNGFYIDFIISRYNNIDQLDIFLKTKYPEMKYSIIIIEPTEDFSVVEEHYKLMGMDGNDIKKEMQS